MSWIQKLNETYDNCRDHIGDPNDKMPLLPICHTAQNAQLEVAIDGNGDFIRAGVVTSNNSTIVPCTEESGGRAGTRPACHPLCDRLQYVAGDFLKYGGEVTSGYAAMPEEPFTNFLETLGKWCASDYSHPKAESVLTYVKKRRLMEDLLVTGILYAGTDGRLLKEWNGDKKKTPEIFRQFSGNAWQANAFVRWLVQVPGNPQDHTWSDHTLWDTWIKYYLSTKKTAALCYVTGETTADTKQHPSKLRSNADRAKLISSNDLSGFTFRGRFANSDQACGVGYEVTQKAHSALRWLIGKQGYRNGGQTVVAWATSGKQIPDPVIDTLGLFDDEETRSELMAPSGTAQHVANSLSKLIAGYHARLGPTDGVVVMGMDSATPGRMSVTFYRELTGSDYLERIIEWHISCSWWQEFGRNKETQEHLRFAGAPSPRDIAWASYGWRVDDKLRKATVERILQCIIDASAFPLDIVRSSVRRTCNRVGFESWEWEKALGITCSIYKHFHKERRYEMGLETDRHSRDYLFGRLLAAADCLEGLALFLAREKRETSAARLMHRYADHPCSTWKNLELSLSPYKARLGARAAKYQRVIDEIMCAFNTDDFVSDKPLGGEFLIGYHCQRKDLWPGGQDSGVAAGEESVDKIQIEEV